MPVRFPRPANRPSGQPATGRAAWRWIALWAGSATVTGFAAATVEPIVELGPGAVVFAGLGGACALGLAFAGSLRLAASREGSPSAAPGGDPILREFAAAIAAQLARLDDKLNAAVADGAAARPGGGDPGPAHEALLQAAQRIEQEQRAILARIVAEAEHAERRARTQAEALEGAVLPRVAGLEEQVGRLRRALAEGDARASDFESQVFDILRARDADEVLRRLDSEASDLFDRLFYADGRSHGTADAWRADYAEWRSRIKSFWDIARGYRTSVDQPFAVPEAEIERAGGVPETALFATPDMRFRFRMLVVVNERHIKFREDAFSFNAKKGAAPEAPPKPPPRAARPALVAG